MRVCAMSHRCRRKSWSKRRRSCPRRWARQRRRHEPGWCSAQHRAAPAQGGSGRFGQFSCGCPAPARSAALSSQARRRSRQSAAQHAQQKLHRHRGCIVLSRLREKRSAISCRKAVRLCRPYRLHTAAPSCWLSSYNVTSPEKCTRGKTASNRQHKMVNRRFKASGVCGKKAWRQGAVATVGNKSGW